MFTGIVEELGIVKKIEILSGGNIEFGVECSFWQELTLGQSIAHNGVCLTVTRFDQNLYFVTAIVETLSKTNLGTIRGGDEINLERCMPANGRFDGHIVQGHVDTVGICEDVTQNEGSWLFVFSHPLQTGYITVTKGSICVNGASLTVVNSEKDNFSVAIIPYTHAHTNFKNIQKGSEVNLEFDILGKYIAKMQHN
ncbi:MAG TPA: riboflavin synthase [Cytophagales bacterium]|jgi:riboflavin synthase|nr:riboflavin synthase [Cytophagales bacterium]